MLRLGVRITDFTERLQVPLCNYAAHCTLAAYWWVAAHWLPAASWQLLEADLGGELVLLSGLYKQIYCQFSS
jgi:hypothetical protein